MKRMTEQIMRSYVNEGRQVLAVYAAGKRKYFVDDEDAAFDYADLNGGHVLDYETGVHA